MTVAPAGGQALFSLAGRTALVTGAGRGIGKALALGLAEAGADLLLLGRPGAQQETRDQLERNGCSVHVLDLDLSDLAETRRIAATIADEHRVDILLNNAGIVSRSPSLDVAAEDWQRVLDVNLSAAFFLTQQIAAPMVARGSGKVINVASLLSYQGGLRVASYAASKHAIAGLTRALANEWAAFGVQVNAIAPGYITTDNTQPLRDDPKRNASISDRIPAGRWGDPADLVGAAVFLASRASDYVNGHVLVVDGGWTAR